MEPFASTPQDPRDVERRFAEMLDAEDLPRWNSSHHDPEIHMLELSWDHGFTLHFDLARDDELAPIDEEERRAILGIPPWGEEPIHVTVAGSPQDPRDAREVPGVVIHYAPELHPDDVTVHDGIRITSPSRTLIDMAEEVTQDELRAMFARAQELGLLDPEALRASRARVEWRPSLAMLDEVIAEFCGD
jgi:hypothetical protein